VRCSPVQTSFSAGMKGVQPADVPRVEALIDDELHRLVAEGFQPDAVRA
jgi:Zn-dependent M16 (insulinase) family peptidase